MTRAERDAQIAAAVLDGGATCAATARQFGLSAERVRQLAKEALGVRAAQRAERDLDDLALALRHRSAIELVDAVDVGGRWALLAAVVAPSDELLEVSSARASDDAEQVVRAHRRCRGCGIPHADGFTRGCKVCCDRRRSRRRRAPARQPSTSTGP